jgi:hypothetical protein
MAKRPTDAVAEEEELADAEVVHQPQLVVGESIPWFVDRDRSRGFAAGGVALVHRDAAEVVLELRHRVDDSRVPIAHFGVQAAAGGAQQRKAGADLLIANADAALVVELERASLRGLLGKHAWRCGRGRCCNAGCEHFTSDRIHHRRPPYSPAGFQA